MPSIHLSGRFYNVALALIGAAYLVIVVAVLAVPARSESPGNRIQQLVRWEAVGSMSPLGLRMAPGGIAEPSCERSGTGWLCEFGGVEAAQTGVPCTLTIEIGFDRQVTKRSATCTGPAPTTGAS